MKPRMFISLVKLEVEWNSAETFYVLRSQFVAWPQITFSIYFCQLFAILDGTYDEPKIPRIINYTAFYVFSGS